MTTDGGPVVLLDIGANPDSSPENLAQYARMGAIFADRVLGVADPAVALLSIGEEKGKGDARIQRATELIDETNLRFVGNVEGKDLVKHMADVVVCDAVLGNVVIKFFEGLSGYIFDLFRSEFRGSLRGRLAYLLLKPGVGRIRTAFDYERAGGSPLLGVRGTVIITHGRARRRMIGYGVAVAATMARTRVPELIGQAFADEAGRSKAADTGVGEAAVDNAATVAADAIDPSPQPEPLESAP
jgi:phosphate acyltransferase